MTYNDVALDCKLDHGTAQRYVKYMLIRWPDTEAQKCQDGYAHEWALRFKNKDEYNASDFTGKLILDEINGGD